MDTSVNSANQFVSVGADTAFDADPTFFSCLVRFESSSCPTTLPTVYDVYPFDGRHDGGYYTVKDCVTIDVLPSTPGNNVYVGFMFFFSSRRRHTRFDCDWSSDVCSSDLRSGCRGRPRDRYPGRRDDREDPLPCRAEARRGGRRPLNRRPSRVSRERGARARRPDRKSVV